MFRVLYENSKHSTSVAKCPGGKWIGFGRVTVNLILVYLPGVLYFCIYLAHEQGK